MKNAFLNRSIVVLTAIILALFAVGGASAQGRGNGGGKHGGGGNNGGGNGNGAGKHDGGDRGRGRVQQPQVQPQMQPQMRPQMRPQPQGNPNVYQQRGNGNGRGNVERRQRNVYIQPQPQHVPTIIYGRPDNYGQQRSREVHQRNAERKAQKDQWKQQREYERQAQSQWQAQRQAQVQRWQHEQARRQQEAMRQQQQYQRQPQYREPQYQYQPQYPQPYQQQPQQYEPQYQPYYQYGQPYAQPYGGGYTPQYSQNYGYGESYDPYDYTDQPLRFSGKDFLRNLIFAVLGANAGYDTGYDPGFTAYGYEMNDPAADSSIGNDYYGSYPLYSGVGTGGYQDSYFNYAPHYEDAYYSDPNATVFPVGFFTEAPAGGNFVRDLFSQLMAVGYDQGYSDGLAARSLGRREAYYADPYAYENSVYDPYSVSIGDNRRCLSQGYSLGYQDAFSRDPQADPRFRSGGVDFLSVLISAASQLI